MRTVFIRWIAIGIGTFAVSLCFLGLHMTSLQADRKTDGDHDIIRQYKKSMRGNVFLKEQIKTSHTKNIVLDSGMLKLKSKLMQLAKEIHKTKVHIRGTKARESVTKAMKTVNDLLRMTNISRDIVRRETQPSKHICGETYKGTTYGYPFFYKGFETLNCSNSTPIEQIVTVILYHKHENIFNLETILKGISNYNKHLKVVIGTNEEIKISPLNTVKVIVYPKSESDGNILNSLIKNVKTEYTLIVRNITIFNIDAKLDRLIREIESLNVTVAAGASRDQRGHWKLGCYQTAFKNYSLAYTEGYDESLHECIFCDYVDASFITKTDTLLKTGFDVKMNGVSVFQDYFLRLSESKHESVVCADSMFYMHKQKRSNDENDWKQFSRKWQLYRMQFSTEVDVKFSCDYSYRCFNGLGFTVTPCCLQELADMVKFIMETCEKYDIICELQEGTLLGAVKLHTVLPWERDADLTFLTANFTAFAKLNKYIRKKYYYSDDPGSLWCCVDNRTAGGKIKVSSKNWHIELYGQHLMDSEMLRMDGVKPTKALLDGQWVGVPRNPGWHARNRYGREIFAHAQHWMATGKGDGWINYETNRFTVCHEPGRHDCLDNFNADGNMQFRNPIP